MEISVLKKAVEWVEMGHSVGSARLISASGSSPLPIGSILFVNDRGKMAGGVSGGCVEPDLVNCIISMLSSDSYNNSIRDFQYSDETALFHGLSCGGSVQVLVEVLDKSVLMQLCNSVINRVPVALVTSLRTLNTSLFTKHEGTITSMGSLENIDSAMMQFAFDEPSLNGIYEIDLKALKLHQIRGLSVIDNDETKAIYFIQTVTLRSRLFIIGANEYSKCLSEFATLLDFETYIIDPRKMYLDEKRFTSADYLINDWPDRVFDSTITLTEHDSVCIVSHDQKLDVVALKSILPLNVGYVGMLGSRNTIDARKNEVIEAGLDPSIFATLHAPIGLDLGGKSPREVSLAIVAEITMEKYHKRSDYPISKK